MEVYSCDCALNEYLSRGPIVCFCYRNCERHGDETGGPADLTVELVPWETCTLS